MHKTEGININLNEMTKTKRYFVVWVTQDYSERNNTFELYFSQSNVPGRNQIFREAKKYTDLDISITGMFEFQSEEDYLDYQNN